MVINEKLDRICLIFLGLKGDVFIRTPIIDAIKAKLPNASISVVVDKNNVNVLENHPDIEQIITLDRNKSSRYQYIKNNLNVVFDIRRGQFDAIINFYCGGSSNFIVRAANTKYRIGFNHTAASRFANNVLVDAPYLPNDHWILYLAHLLKPLGIEPASVKKGATFHISDKGKKQAELILKDYAKQKLILLNLGTGVKSKCLPIQSYVALSLKLYALEGIIPVVFTNPGMEYLTEDYINLLDNQIPVVRIPLTPFDTEAAIMDQCDAVITGDTSLMHLAIALEKKTIALFLETDPVCVSPTENWFTACDFRQTAPSKYVEIITDCFKKQQHSK